MTRSFTSMLLGLQYLAACQADDTTLLKSLGRMPELAQVAMDRLHSRVRDLVNSRQFADYVCLGQGPFYRPGI